MNKAFLKQLDFSPPEKDLKDMNEQAKIIIERLKKEIKKKNMQIQIFLGGSFAKNTLVQRKSYDVDIYLRCNSKILSRPEKIKKLVEEIARKEDMNFEIIHGSRDYYQIKIKEEVVFEIIPVLKISNPKKAENVTDLSYFHVAYVNKRLNKKLEREVRITKKFCQSIGVYGAESWIRGLSGYAVECLIIYYKTFDNFVKNIAKIKKGSVIDIAKLYRKNEALIEMNESRRQSPIIVVDPTYKERNVISALSDESFNILQEKAKNFIKSPSLDYFVIPESRVEELRKIQSENLFISFSLTTDKQAGDIAGTKLKRVCEFIIREIEKTYFVKNYAFDYYGKEKAICGVLVSSDKLKEKMGPPDKMKEAVKGFRKVNPNAVLRKGKWYATIENRSINEYVKEVIEKYQKVLNEMGLNKIEID